MDRRCVAPGTLSEGDLLAYLDGEALPEVRGHIACCPACAADLAALIQAGALARPALCRVEKPASGPPRDEQPRSAGAAQLRAARIAPGQPAPALRGASASGHYRAGPYLVIVALTPPPLPEAGWQLEGQISHSGGAEALAQGGEALLLRGESVLLRDQIDETGFFTLDPIQPGVYLLELALPDARISIPDLSII